jgi:rhodanese-related sulfurtransferase
MAVPEIDVVTLAIRRDESTSLIDVRRPDEFEVARVPGARLIPLGDLVERIDEVPTEGTVYVICATGARSARAAEHFRSLGIDAVNVAGGTKAWMEAGYPIERAGSEAGPG